MLNVCKLAGTSCTVFFSFYLFAVNFFLNVFGSSTSKKSGGISKKKPGPKVGSKRALHANRPDPKRLMDQPNLQQQRLDKMTLVQSVPTSSSTLQENQQVSPFNIINSKRALALCMAL
ncbi:hypothetical protein INT48_009339 [Thamnidium elegans]|uniref:Uncharacterized protein n=1 Tax=Thamnidium elegans TaxID=101142 RepID=A0A8H7SQI2_9FUNG|nr:hypothetical protein INT48_009339 [Thamnidium elegans]